MNYDEKGIDDSEIPRAPAPIFQHLLKTYASEANKLNSVWLEFSDDDLDFRPHARSSTVREIIEHQLPSFSDCLSLLPNKFCLRHARRRLTRRACSNYHALA